MITQRNLKSESVFSANRHHSRERRKFHGHPRKSSGSMSDPHSPTINTEIFTEK
jgi:hypothetical protein